MNQPAFKEDNTWGSEAVGEARAKIRQAWVESNEAPGKYLKQLRELQQKSVKEMAAELGVSVSQLQALEENNKEELPAPIYVKSYIKRYCVCLGVSESEISSVLAEIAKEVLPTLNRVSIKQNTNPRQDIMRWFGYALAATVVVLLIFGVKSLDLTGMWKSVSSPSEAVESTATELSLPVVIEETEPGKTQETK